MSNIKFSLTTKCLVICVLFFSCSNNAKQSGNTGKTFNFNLKFPDHIRYYYTIHNQTTTTASFNNKKINTGSNAEIGLIYNIAKDSSGNFQTTLTYDKLHITMKNADYEQELNAANAGNSLNPVEKVLGTILGSSLIITMDSNGHVLQVTGSREITARILEAVNTQDAYVRKQVQEQASKLVGEQFIQNNLEQVFNMLPDSAVSIGDSWTRTLSQTADIQFNAAAEYTLTRVSDSIATIELESQIDEINFNNNAALGAAGFALTTDLKGHQTGSIQLSLVSGVVINCETNTTIKGSIQASGRSVPVEISMKKKISAHKI